MMFLGVKSHHDARPVVDYETAERALLRASRTPTGKARREKTHGYHLDMNHNHGVTWVRKDDDGAIIFRLYDTDVVIWHPGDVLEVENFGTVTTTGFASRFTPSGMHLAHTTRGGGHRGIYFSPRADSSWSGRHVCQGDVVRFLPNSAGGWDADEETLDTMRFPELDRVKARKALAGHDFVAFENWLSMAPRHLRIEHNCWDIGVCDEALLEKDWRRAAEHLPLITIPSGFGLADRIKPLPIITKARDEVVTLASVRKLRLALWHWYDAFSIVEVKTILSTELERRMARVREMRKLDIYEARNMGLDG